jgi:lysozyme
VSAYAPDPRPKALVRANVGKGAGVTAGALAVACALIAAHEGEVRHTYVDRLGRGGDVLTYCYGSTQGAVAGKTYSHAECTAALLADAQQHAADIAPCLPSRLSDKTSGAMVDFGYNVGATTFCKSSVSRKALSGDLRGACRAIGLYVYTNGKDCRLKASKCAGIIKRRADEVAVCEGGLS